MVATDRGDDYDRICSQLLLSDAELALTFASIAAGTTDRQRRTLTLGHARAAYEWICNSLGIVHMSTEDLARLGAKLRTLNAMLEALNYHEAPASGRLNSPPLA